MTPKDRALHTIGRTVVNFQRLEKVLKALTVLTPIQGTIESIEGKMQRRIEKANQSTLGAAITLWLNNINSQHEHANHEADLF